MVYDDPTLDDYQDRLERMAQKLRLARDGLRAVHVALATGAARAITLVERYILEEERSLLEARLDAAVPTVNGMPLPSPEQVQAIDRLCDEVDGLGPEAWRATDAAQAATGAIALMKAINRGT